jgi:hypothetical protein
MKTGKPIYVLLILFMVAACNTDDEPRNDITPINIPDEIFFKYLLDNFDANKDGKLSTEEAGAIKEIIFSKDEFIDVSIQGLDYFKNLEKLTLKLISVGDTLNLSNNTKLKELYINNTQIQYLDISMNTQLM